MGSGLGRPQRFVSITYKLIKAFGLTYCLKDPQTYFFFFITIINALPNGANTTFSKLIWKSFGFTPLETLLKGSTPYYCVSICWFLVVGYVTLKKPNIRCEFPYPSSIADSDLINSVLMMMFSLIPAFSGMMALAFLPQDSMKWTRWGMYILQVFGSLPGLSKSHNMTRLHQLTCCASDLDVSSFERCWSDQEDCHRYYNLCRILCW